MDYTSHLLYWSETHKSPDWQQMLRGIPMLKVREHLRQAILDQDAIGWNYAFQGYLSTQWVCAQHAEHPKSTKDRLCQQWLKIIICKIWKVVTIMCEERNHILHADTLTSKAILESSIHSKIQHLYAIQDPFAWSDHYLFLLPKDQRLLQSQRLKNNGYVLLQGIIRRHRLVNGANSPLSRNFWRFRLLCRPPRLVSHQIGYKNHRTSLNPSTKGYKIPQTSLKPTQSLA